MAFLGTLGLAPGYVLTRPRFDSKGMIFKPIFYNMQMDDIIPHKRFIFIDLVVGVDVVQFSPYEANDVLGRFSNPFHILHGAVMSIRRRNQWLSAISAWSNVYPDNPGSGFSCVNMFSRTVLPAIIYRDDETVYEVPRGLQGPKVLLGLSPTAINGLLEQAHQLGPRVQDPDGPVFYLEPRKAKATGSTATMSSYAVTAIENPNPALAQMIARLSEESFDFSSVLKPLSIDEQLELLVYSGIPKSAVVYALNGTDLLARLPQSYIDAGNEELRVLQQNTTIPYTGQFPSMPPAAFGAPLPTQQFHPEAARYKQAELPMSGHTGQAGPTQQDGAFTGAPVSPISQQPSPTPVNPPTSFTYQPAQVQPPVVQNPHVPQAPFQVQPVRPAPTEGRETPPPRDQVSNPAQQKGADVPELPKSISDLIKQVRDNVG